MNNPKISLLLTGNELMLGDTITPSVSLFSRRGGAFASVPLGESGQAGMTIVDDRKTD